MARKTQVNCLCCPWLKGRGGGQTLERKFVKETQAGSRHAFAVSAVHAGDLAVHPLARRATQNTSGCGRTRLTCSWAEQGKHVRRAQVIAKNPGGSVAIVIKTIPIDRHIKRCATGIFVDSDLGSRRFHRGAHSRLSRPAKRTGTGGKVLNHNILVLDHRAQGNAVIYLDDQDQLLRRIGRQAAHIKGHAVVTRKERAAAHIGCVGRQRIPDGDRRDGLGREILQCQLIGDVAAGPNITGAERRQGDGLPSGEDRRGCRRQRDDGEDQQRHQGQGDVDKE